LSKQPTRSFQRYRFIYVDPNQGWRFFFVSIVISCVLGLSIRLHFSPAYIKNIVSKAISTQKFTLNFARAELALSSGVLPLLALRLSQVELIPHPDCESEPSLRMAEVTVPFRILDLLRGHIAMGVVRGADLVVDLDLIKKNCLDTIEKPTGAFASKGSRSAPSLTPINSAANLPGRSASSGVDLAPKTINPPKTINQGLQWWSAEQFAILQDMVDGFAFSRVEFQFEKKTKKVYLDDLRLGLSSEKDMVNLTGDLRLSPEVTFGEKVAPFAIDLTATANRADIRVATHLNEGRLDIVATLRPLENSALEIDANAALKSAPISLMVPLLVKAGIVSEAFHPRFLWFSCNGAIKGRFQGLFASSPLRLSDCSIEGGGGSRVALTSATRLPGGGWKPFFLQIENLDVRRALDTFSLQGPQGIANDFGRLSGKLEILGPEDGRFEGHLAGADLRFSRRSVRVHQGVRRVGLSGDIHHGEVHLVAAAIDLEGGEFKGGIELNLDHHLERGQIKLHVEKLSFAPSVETLLVNGKLGSIVGEAQLNILNRRFNSIQGQWLLPKVVGRDYRFKNLEIKMATQEKGVELFIRAPNFELAQNSEIANVVLNQPIFFEHDFDGDWMEVKEAQLRMLVSPQGMIDWDLSRASMEQGRIHLQSAGSVSSEKRVSGWVSVDYPLVKKLRWSAEGSLPNVTLIADSKNLIELRRRKKIDDEVLGLPVSAEGKVVETQTTQALRSLGERVIQKIRAN
jgi:hypothetical protein